MRLIEEEKVDSQSFSFEKRYLSPNDKIEYIIPNSAIQYTEKVLLEYADIDPSNEGLVYWGGTITGEVYTILMVIAPETKSNFGRVSTSNRANFDVVRTLNKNNLFEIGQVHSHPGKWVDHSQGDDEFTPFKVEGLISIVIPQYCKYGIKQLADCGVHRYTNCNFIRLSRDYIKNHFKILNDAECRFVDLRK